MHILLIPSWHATEQNPTRGHFFYAQARALKNAGHQVGLLVPPSRLRTLHGLGEVRRYWWRKNTDLLISEDNGIPVYRIPWWGLVPSVMPAHRMSVGVAAFEQVVRDHGRPDILHAHSILYGGYLAAAIGQQYAIPVVVTEHNSRFLAHTVYRDQMPSVQYTLRHTQAVTAVSGALAEALATYGAADVRIIGNMVDTGFFRPAGTPPPAQPFVFTIVADLNPNKGHDILLQAFAGTFRGQDMRLWVIGDGRIRSKYERMALELGIQGQVLFHGRQSPSGVRDLVQRSHVIVSSSYHETFGVSLIEAMACGKPVVATRSGGPEHFMNEDNGILVNPGDVAALAEALVRIHENYHLYDPKLIRQVCVERFSEAAIVRQLETVYKGVLRG